MMDNGDKIMFYQEVTNRILKNIVNQRRKGAEEEEENNGS